MEEQKLLEAMKVLQDYCHGKWCSNCLLSSKDSNRSTQCRLKQTSPDLYRIKTEEKTIYKWGE